MVHYQVVLCSDSYDTMLLLQTSYVSKTSWFFHAPTYKTIAGFVIRAILYNGVSLRLVC